jgi:oligosaccharide repeat unit polymerase
MYHFIFWTVYISTPILFLILLRISNEKLNRISITNVLGASLYLFSVVGTLPLFYEMDIDRLNMGINNKQIVLEVLFYSSVNLIAYVSGVFYSRKILGLNQYKTSKQIISLQKYQLIKIIFIISLCCFILHLYLSKVDNIALFVAINSTHADAAIARSLMGNEFENYHRYKIFIYDVTQFISYILIANCIIKPNRLNYFLCGISLCLSIFSSLLSIEKGPVLWFLIGCYFSYLYVKNDGLISIRKFFSLSLILILILILFYLLLLDAPDLKGAISVLLSRIITGQISPAYFYVNYFPYLENYLLGTSFPNPGGVLPFEPNQFTVSISNWITPQDISSGVVGSAPTVFWGESYANFGPVSIPLISLIIGIVMTCIDHLISNLKRNALSIGLSVWLVLHYRELSSTGFSGFLVDLPLMIIILAYYFVLLKFDTNGKKNLNNH